jgi:hypothetical protein
MSLVVTRPTVNGSEPFRELPEVLSKGSPAVHREVMRFQVAVDEGGFLFTDREALENIIARILAGFWTEIRQHVDTPMRLLG